jgi:hypothetical protein
MDSSASGEEAGRVAGRDERAGERPMRAIYPWRPEATLEKRATATPESDTIDSGVGSSGKAVVTMLQASKRTTIAVGDRAHAPRSPRRAFHVEEDEWWRRLQQVDEVIDGRADDTDQAGDLPDVRLNLYQPVRRRSS